VDVESELHLPDRSRNVLGKALDDGLLVSFSSVEIRNNRFIGEGMRATAAWVQAARTTGPRIKVALTNVGMRLADHRMRGAWAEPTACMMAAQC
jgi:hypothetical protein